MRCWMPCVPQGDFYSRLYPSIIVMWCWDKLLSLNSIQFSSFLSLYSSPAWWCPSPNVSSLISWWETSSCQAPFQGSFSRYISWPTGTKLQICRYKTATENGKEEITNKGKKKQKQATDLCLGGRSLRTVIASMRILSTLFWVPAKLVTGIFLLAATLAHAGIVLFTFLTLDFSYL